MMFQIGFQWTNPLTLFGEISLWVLASSIIAIIGFFVASFFIYKYYKKFYVGEVPKGWQMFFLGLMLMAYYQIVKIPFTYRWIYGDINVSIFLIFQLVAVGFLVKRGVPV